MSEHKVQLVIRSGGQTGADRGALDAAMDVGCVVTGWCPRGRLAEDTPIPERYPLQETESNRYAIRTDWNVRDADATLIVARKPLEGGTALTEQYCIARHKPCFIFDPYQADSVTPIVQWVQQLGIGELNVAGPRGTKDTEIYQRTYDTVKTVLQTLAEPHEEHT